MSDKKNIQPYNNNHQKHGYWEMYYDDGSLSYKGHYVNGKRDSLWEWYHSWDELMHKEYYNNHLGNIEGISINE